MKKLLLLFLLPLSVFAQGPVRRVDTVADLSSIKPLASSVESKLTVIVSGYHAVGDIDPIIVRWAPSSADAIDNGCVFGVSSGGGRFLADDCASGTINVKHFGAYGNGVTNDSAAVIAARSAAVARGAALYYPKGSYLLSTYGITVYGPRIEPFGSLYIPGTVAVSNLFVSNSITLGGETRTTWPTNSGGGGGISLSGVRGDTIYHDGTNWVALGHPGVNGRVIASVNGLPAWADFDSGDINFITDSTPFTNITTAARLALSLTTTNKGHTLLDTDLDALMVWNGTNWFGFPIGTPWAASLPESKLTFVCGALRQNTTNRAIWNFITNATHRPIGFGGDFAIASTNSITLALGRTFKKVIACGAYPDETFAGGANVQFGAAGSTTNIVIKAGTFFAGSFVLRYTGATWSVTSVSGADVQPAVAYTNGVLRITHDYLRGGNANVSAWSNSGGNYGFIPAIKSVTDDYLDLQWLDPASAGGVYTSATPLWRMTAAVTLRHFGPLDMAGNNSEDSLLGEDTSVGGNIWVWGLFENN